MSETKIPTTSVKIPKELEIFIDSLLIQKGLVDLSPELRNQLREDLYYRLEKWILTDMLSRVPDEESEKLEKLMDTAPSPEKITNYLQSVIPDYYDVYDNSLSGFKSTYLA